MYQNDCSIAHSLVDLGAVRWTDQETAGFVCILLPSHLLILVLRGADQETAGFVCILLWCASGWFPQGVANPLWKVTVVVGLVDSLNSFQRYRPLEHPSGFLKKFNFF